MCMRLRVRVHNYWYSKLVTYLFILISQQIAWQNRGLSINKSPGKMRPRELQLHPEKPTRSSPTSQHNSPKPNNTRHDDRRSLIPQNLSLRPHRSSGGKMCKVQITAAAGTHQPKPPTTKDQIFTAH